MPAQSHTTHHKATTYQFGFRLDQLQLGLTVLNRLFSRDWQSQRSESLDLRNQVLIQTEGTISRVQGIYGLFCRRFESAPQLVSPLQVLELFKPVQLGFHVILYLEVAFDELSMLLGQVL